MSADGRFIAVSVQTGAVYLPELDRKGFVQRFFRAMPV